MNGINYIDNAIKQAILDVHTTYLAKVISISGNVARLQPLTIYKALGGEAKEPSPTTAIIPPNLKIGEKTITYMVSDTQTETTTVLVPENLSVGDIVQVGVCERDISNAIKGIISEATNRHHDINDGIILRFVG